MQVNAAAGANVNEIETYRQRCQYYEQHIEELKKNYEKTIKEYQYKYLEIKEQYDLLVYKRFARSAEELLADAKQQLLFAEETGQGETGAPAEAAEKPDELVTPVRSFNRKKGGRKPLSANLERREKIIDIEESEKTCACGANLTRIGN